MTEKDTHNGNNEDMEVEKKPGIVRKISKITFRIGPIKQEDLSTPELNKLMAMAQKFEITFDTIPILDSDQTDKLGYVTLPFEIRTQEYLLVLYDRLSNLKLNPARDVSAKFPDEFKKYVEEVRQVTAEQRKQKMEELRKKADYHKRSVYATFVDKDTGKDSLTEKFPDAKSVNVSQHNFQWYGIVEFDSQEKALEVMKANNNEIEIEGNKVKLVRTSPNPEDEKQKRAEMDYKGPPSMRTSRGGRGGGGGRQNRGGGGSYNQSPKSLLSLPGGAGGGGGGGGNKQAWKQGGKAKSFGGQGGQGYRNQSGGGGGGGGRYQDYGGDYGGGYGGGRNQGFGGNFNMGGKRKSDYSDFGGGQAKRPFNQRGGYGGGRGGSSGGGGGGWNRF